LIENVLYLQHNHPIKTVKLFLEDKGFKQIQYVRSPQCKSYPIFVYHYGITTIRKIGPFEKLFGSDVTLTHKLLKNTISLDDYLLTTSAPKFSEGFHKPDWMAIKEASSTYSEIGEVPFYYISLAPLRSKIGKMGARTQFHRFGKPVSAKKNINIPLKRLHGIVTDFSLRPKWIFGLKLIRDNTDHLNTIGSKHLCVMPTTTMEFVITAQHIEEGTIEYVEQSNSIKWLVPFLKRGFCFEKDFKGYFMYCNPHPLQKKLAHEVKS